MVSGVQTARPTESGLLPAVRHFVLLVLLALAGYLAVRLLLAVVSPESRFEPIELAAPAQAAADAPKSYDFSYNPFAAGDAVDGVEASTVTEAPSTDDAPETTLNLTLTGLRAGPNGSAFIQTPDGQADNYYVGDEIMNGVYLREVRVDHIVLDVNGQAQKLTSEDAKNARRDDANAAPSQGSGKLSTLKSVSPADLIKKFEIIPYLGTDMKRQGVRLKARSPGVSLMDYGFKDDDVFTSIAGQSLTAGFPDPVALSRALQPGRPVVVQFIRDGAPMSITIG